MDGYRLIDSFRKNARERVQVGLGQFQGHDLADLRVFYEAADGEYLPSKKGLTLQVGQLDELAVAVDKLREAVAESVATGS